MHTYLFNFRHRYHMPQSHTYQCCKSRLVGCTQTGHEIIKSRQIRSTLHLRLLLICVPTNTYRHQYETNDKQQQQQQAANWREIFSYSLWAPTTPLMIPAKHARCTHTHMSYDMRRTCMGVYVCVCKHICVASRWHG